MCVCVQNPKKQKSKNSERGVFGAEQLKKVKEGQKIKSDTKIGRGSFFADSIPFAISGDFFHTHRQTDRHRYIRIQTCLNG